MDEPGWLACTDPEPMLGFLRAKGSGRKLRLFACACCWRIWHLLTDSRSREAVRLAAGCAEGRVTPEALAAARGAAWDAEVDTDPSAWDGPIAMIAGEEPSESWYVSRAGAGRSHAVERHAARAAWAAAGPDSRVCALGASDAAADAVASAAPCSDRAPWGGWAASRAAERAAQAALLRDLVGNPFRDVHVDPVWRTPPTMTLARAVYDGLQEGTVDPVSLAVLADALEESGCTDPVILDHFRAPGYHVRGCHILDLLLQRS